MQSLTRCTLMSLVTRLRVACPCRPHPLCPGFWLLIPCWHAGTCQGFLSSFSEVNGRGFTTTQEWGCHVSKLNLCTRRNSSAVLQLMSSSDHRLCNWKSPQLQKWTKIWYVNVKVGWLVGWLVFFRAQNQCFLTFPAPPHYHVVILTSWLSCHLSSMDNP